MGAGSTGIGEQGVCKLTLVPGKALATGGLALLDLLIFLVTTVAAVPPVEACSNNHHAQGKKGGCVLAVGILSTTWCP